MPPLFRSAALIAYFDKSMQIATANPSYRRVLLHLPKDETGIPPDRR
ncbi:hypothetical protein RHECNPAF_4310080 [Rhizobium etli CNPAF512]|nr:hypothetical protein RHECNPAF_4310080 [Rhizobium etli CNPAF512]